MRWSLPLSLILLFSVTFTAASAQTQAQPGDPPIAALISISSADAAGNVTITGANGAVYPAAQIAVRNLYTGQSAYVQAGITGSFSAIIPGGGNTPYWISPVNSLTPEERDQPGSLPGGPGVILYGAFPSERTETSAAPITRVVIDGDLSDWDANYTSAQQQTSTGANYALLNADSLYLAAENTMLQDDSAAQYRVTFTLDGAVYAVTFNPSLAQAGSVRRLDPNPNDLGVIAIAASVTPTTIELRLPWTGLNAQNPTVESASFDGFDTLNADAGLIEAYNVGQGIQITTERDGIFRNASPLADSEATRFTVGGFLAQGASFWNARGRVNQLDFQPGEQLILELDVTLNAPALPASLVGLQMIGRIVLQPVVDAEGQPGAGGLHSNNGWSNMLTPSGLPVGGTSGDIVLTEVIVPAQHVVRRDGQVLFPLDFDLSLPDDLPAGVYVPVLQGYGQVADGDRFRWEDNGLLGTGTGRVSRSPLTRLPLVFNIGEIRDGRVLWTLFYDDPSDGSRGVIAEQDTERAGVFNGVRYNSPTYILPPGAYAVEPYLLNQLPNLYDSSAAPLVPYLVGRLQGRITLPDGSVDDLGAAEIAQNRLSSFAPDERSVFGAYAPVDAYRLTTLNPLFTAYNFSRYGEYEIELSGSAEDFWGNRYTGGGTYRLTIAEPLDLTPGALSGTPFQVGDVLSPVVRVAPHLPAEVTVRVRTFPLDGDPTDQTFSGTASIYGYFHAGEVVCFDTPGEYVIDYEARYEDATGKLWAASLRSAGVITPPDETSSGCVDADAQTEAASLSAHGQRGTLQLVGDPRAWFFADTYAPDIAPFVNMPYHAGDVAWIADGRRSGVRTILRVQDTGGAYTDWLTANLPDYTSAEGLPLSELIVLDELPLITSEVNRAYAYLSAVRPAVTVRQGVYGGENTAVPMQWDSDDPLNRQIGAGVEGNQPGDFVFLFGGAVVDNAEAGVRETAGYAALATTLPDGDPAGVRVLPPYSGEAGGPNGGPLLTLRGEAISLFFHPTGVTPGQVLLRGEPISVSGQVAPTLRSRVTIRLTAPDGTQSQFEGATNAYGYFYHPEFDLPADQPGVWTVEISATAQGATSVGVIEPPPPVGGVIGTVNGRFSIYVVDGVRGQLAYTESKDREVPAATPINFTLNIPDGWSEVTGEVSLYMEGYLLAQSGIPLGARSFSYQYNPAALTRDFPMLEIDGRPEGPYGTDVVTITLVLRGVENGTPQIRLRTFTVMHDRVVSLQP